MCSNQIEFLGKCYPTKSVWVPTFGDQLISTTELSDALLTDDEIPTEDIYINDEAQRIDEAIFFYLDLKNFALPNRVIGKLIRQSIG